MPLARDKGLPSCFKQAIREDKNLGYGGVGVLQRKVQTFIGRVLDGFTG
jgi:hypothetical protein